MILSHPCPHLLLLLVELLCAWQACEVQWRGTPSACGMREEMLQNWSTLEVGCVTLLLGCVREANQPSLSQVFTGSIIQSSADATKGLVLQFQAP